MIWLNFLHFYQPANTESYNIHKALDKSYWRLLRLLEEHPELRMTANVSGCLLERLAEEKEDKFLERLKFLVKKGRLELTGSAAYHGFLPLLPETEIIRQIRVNEKILRKYFGPKFKPAGFFLPEMAYSPAVAKIVKRLGYRWIILDEIAYGGPGRPDPSARYRDEASGLAVIFRSRSLSGTYPPDQLWPLFQKGRDGIYITATDAELYGLRHEDPTGELERLVKIKELRTMAISRWLNRTGRPKPAAINLRASSWESTPAELRRRAPYALWQNKNNKIQTDLWKLANLALALGNKYPADKNFYWYRWHLSRGLASCTFWWASARDFSRIYGPYAWSPDDIERGLEDLIRAVRSFYNPRTKSAKLEAERYYLRIKKRIWEEHWRKHWQKTI